MKRRFQSTLKSALPPAAALCALMAAWWIAAESGMVPGYMLPSPGEVARAFIEDFHILMEHTAITLKEAFFGLAAGVLLGLLFAVAMDAFGVLYRAFYPLIVITQTIPTVAIAPLLVLWFGYEMLPKVILIAVTTFFPVTVGLLEGFRAADRDAIAMLRSMGAGRAAVAWYIKWPMALPGFLSGLRIAAAYSVVGAVIAEWLGGFGGLGVYMTRVKKAFAFDKMFAVILLISAISLLLMLLISLLERRCTRYRRIGKDDCIKREE